MGNQNGKGRISNLSVFSIDELKVLEASYKAAAGHSDKLTKEKLMQSCSTVIDERLLQYTSNFLFTKGGQRMSTINFERFAEPFYIIERGTIDEKLSFMGSCLNIPDLNDFPMKELENYITSVFKTYIAVEEELGSTALNCWKSMGYQSTERSIFAFSKGMLRTVNTPNEHRVGTEQLSHWLQVNPTFLIIWREVFEYMYSKNAKTHRLGDSVQTNILPIVEGAPANTHYVPLIDIPHVMFINSNLPSAFRHKWRFLFSSKIMGESFSTMLGKIQNRGPTVIIIEDEDRYIFGAFAPEPWALKPAFVGNDTCMLFTLCPALRCFSASGYNHHYQYLNLHQQTMPNGLGMGGQFNYWGLWIDSEYGHGQSSETCTTFKDYVQLSKRKEFRIRHLEVWGMGDEPKFGDSDSDEETNLKKGSSVLDRNKEDRVMLELSGKTMHSDGLRDPDMDS